MNKVTQQKALACAVTAAQAAGKLMRSNARSVKKINEATHHDIKLELDVRCQKVIERTLRRSFPSMAVLGEEGTVGDINAEFRWVVDPIDGTVNFTYGIPHACVSIALQRRLGEFPIRARPRPSSSSSILGSSGAGRSEHEDEGRGRAREMVSHPDLAYQTIVDV